MDENSKNVLKLVLAAIILFVSIKNSSWTCSRAEEKRNIQFKKSISECGYNEEELKDLKPRYINYHKYSTIFSIQFTIVMMIACFMSLKLLLIIGLIGFIVSLSYPLLLFQGAWIDFILVSVYMFMSLSNLICNKIINLK